MSAEGPPAGVHNERTALAWQRTALSLLAGSAIVTRLSLDDLGILAVAAFSVVLVLVALVLRESRQRYHRHAGMHRGPSPRGGRTPALVALVTALIGLTELGALAARH